MKIRKDVRPGDLIRPRKNYNVTIWNDVVREASGAVLHMDSPSFRRLGQLKAPAIVIAVDKNPNALVVWYQNAPVWVWRHTVVLIGT